MQGVGGDASAGKLPSKFISEQQVHEFRPAVLAPAVVAPLRHEVAEVDARLAVGFGRNIYDAGMGAGFKPVQEQAGKEEVGKMVDREGGFQTIHGSCPL